MTSIRFHGPAVPVVPDVPDYRHVLLASSTSDDHKLHANVARDHRAQHAAADDPEVVAIDRELRFEPLDGLSAGRPRQRRVTDLDGQRPRPSANRDAACTSS